MDCIISIIIPVYNAQKYLDRCIQSILNQKFTQFEIILVDDGSTDNSGEICDSYAASDTRIKVIHQKNGGVSVARNTGIKNATGKYIDFVDADDFLDNNLFEQLAEKAFEYNSDVVIYGMKKIRVIDDKIVKEDMKKIVPGTFSVNDFMAFYENYVTNTLFGPVWNKLYKHDIITQNSILFDEEKRHNEDNYFNYSVFENSNTVTAVDDVFYNYVDENPFSASKKKIDFFNVYCGTYARAIDFLNNIGVSENSIPFQNTYFLKLVYGSIYNRVDFRSYKDVSNDVNDILNNPHVKNALKNIKTRDITTFIRFILMKYKLTFILVYYIKLSKMLKHFK